MGAADAMSLRRALVTGGTGFIGRWAVAALRDAGCEVHAVTHREPPAAGGNGVVWHRADLHDTPATRQLLADDTTVLYHLGAYYVRDASTGVRWDDPTLGIEWPLPPEVVSDQDRAWGRLTR